MQLVQCVTVSRRDQKASCSLLWNRWNCFIDVWPIQSSDKTVSFSCWCQSMVNIINTSLFHLVWSFQDSRLHFWYLYLHIYSAVEAEKKQLSLRSYHCWFHRHVHRWIGSAHENAQRKVKSYIAQDMVSACFIHDNFAHRNDNHSLNFWGFH